ncbi:hypothetical protein HanIR_Chr06g0294091 [Helianthus annuus]|nr:hypothetical protein HanIR_Chr06g0294091 [Helianthus annuus]
MYKHICHTGGLAIFLVTANQIIKYPEKFITAPSNKTTHGGDISLIKPDMIPTLPPKSLNVLRRLRVLWSYPRECLMSPEYRANM